MAIKIYKNGTPEAMKRVFSFREIVGNCCMAALPWVSLDPEIGFLPGSCMLEAGHRGPHIAYPSDIHEWHDEDRPTRIFELALKGVIVE